MPILLHKYTDMVVIWGYVFERERESDLGAGQTE